MFTGFVIGLVIKNLGLFVLSFIIVCFCHHFFKFKHIIRKTFWLFFGITSITSAIGIVSMIEKNYWMINITKKLIDAGVWK